MIVLLFFAVGEAVVRIDKKFKIFDASQFLVMESSMLENETIKDFGIDFQNQGTATRRIMLIGDSWINGRFLPPDSTFAKRFERKMNSGNDTNKVDILNLSKPGSNTGQNAKIFFEYADKYKPTDLLWFYSYTDVYLVPEFISEFEEMENDFSFTRNVNAIPDSSEEEIKKSTINSIKKNLYQKIQIIPFITSSIARELRLLGIEVPGSGGYYLRHFMYDENNKNWQYTLAVLDHIHKYCKENQIDMKIVINVDMTVVENLNVYKELDDYLLATFSEMGIGTIYLQPYFTKIRATRDEYARSRYDGHPNSRAHSKVTEFIFGEFQ